MAGYASYQYMHPSKNGGILVRTGDAYLGTFTSLCDAKKVLAKRLKVQPNNLPRRSKKKPRKASKYMYVYLDKSGMWEVRIPKKRAKGVFSYIGRFESEKEAVAAVKKHLGREPCARKKAASETKRSGRARFIFLKDCFKDCSSGE